MKQKLKGCEELRLHRTKCSMLIKNVIAPEMLSEIIADVGGNEYSLILDESTDVSVSKYMAVCIRYQSAKLKVINTAFLGLVQVVSTTAVALVDALCDFLAKIGIQIKKCVGLGSDGASNMVGIHNSVYTRLREKSGNPDLVLFKCICHSLHLCTSKAGLELPTSIDYMLQQTYTWFSMSPIRRTAYQQVYALLNDGAKGRGMVQLAATRWLSRYGAVETVLSSYLELSSHFERASLTERCYAARVLNDMYKDEASKLYLLFLKPILKEFQKTNLLFQKTSADHFYLLQELESFVLTLLRRFLRRNSVSIEVSLESGLESIYLPVSEVDFGYEFQTALDNSSKSISEKDEILRRCHNFLKVVASEALKRLPPNLAFLKKIKVFSPQICLNGITRPRFQELPLSLLKGRDLSQLENQWRNLLQVDWVEIFKGELPVSAEVFWFGVGDYKDMLNRKPFFDIAQAALSVLSMPISNAVVERVFSVMNVVKHKIRNRMQLKMLNSVVTIRLWLNCQSKCCKDLDPTPAMLNRFTSDMYNDILESPEEDEDEDDSYQEVLCDIEEGFAAF